MAFLLLFCIVNACLSDGVESVSSMRNMEKGSFSGKIGFLRAAWWVIHLVGIAAMYTLGHLLWR